MPTEVRKIGSEFTTFSGIFDSISGSGNGIVAGNVTVAFDAIKDGNFVTITWQTASLEAGTTSVDSFRTSSADLPIGFRPMIDVYALTSTRLGASTQKIGAILFRPSGDIRIYNDSDLTTVWTTSNTDHIVRSGSITYKVS